MLEFSSGRGILIPPSFSEFVKRLPKETDHDSSLEFDAGIIALHNDLSTLVAPATPHAIHLLMKRGRMSDFFIGDLRILWWMVTALILSLCGFVGLAMSPYVTAESISASYLTLTGLSQFFVLMFILCSAMIGSSIANLFKLYHYVSSAQFERRYEVSYQVRFFLGIAAGLILAELVPNSFGDEFTKPLVALLSGFAARAVEEVLNRLVETLRTLVNGRPYNTSDAATTSPPKASEPKTEVLSADALMFQKFRDAIENDEDPAKTVATLREAIATSKDEKPV